MRMKAMIGVLWLAFSFALIGQAQSADVSDTMYVPAYKLVSISYEAC